ncbi:DUF6218 family protein [Micromonospora sp. NPDC049801]|uniref:DUF6218 family protein n=1 Tax=unclassified Micromonospora TaxID=2617518 RepID=UPI00340D8AA1
MTSAVDAPENELSIPLDYVPGARGHAVLAIGHDEAGSESLAVWRLGATGRAVGAWVLPLKQLQQDNEYFQRLMGLLRDRCLVDWDTGTPVSVIDRLAANVPAQLSAALKRNVVAIPDLLQEVTEQRAAIVLVADDYRRTAKSKVAPLVWPSEVPSVAELRELTAGARRAAASPVAASALALSAGLARVAQLWQDTEQVRCRRRYLRSLSEPRLLPPRWLSILQAAAGTSE